jgi:hypothetical protein
MSVAFSVFVFVWSGRPRLLPLTLGVDPDLESPNPQPAIVFWPSHQPAPHRILPNVFHFLFEALLRPQHMVKRLLLPNRTRSSERPVQDVRRRRFNPLQNLNQAVKISVQIPKRCQQKMHMVGHHDNGMNRRLRSLIMQTVPQHNVSGRFRQRIEAAAKGNKRRPIVFLIVRQPPSIFALPLQQCLSHQNVNNE